MVRGPRSLRRMPRNVRRRRGPRLRGVEVGERDVEEIAGAAGRIEDARRAEASWYWKMSVWACAVRPRSACERAKARTLLHSVRSGSTTVGRTRRRWWRARGVVGAEFVALGEIEGALRQRAEDGMTSLHWRRAAARRRAELGAADREGRSVGEEYRR